MKKITQVRFEIDEITKRVLDTIKGKYGLPNRSEALKKFVKKYDKYEQETCNHKKDVVKENIENYNTEQNNNYFKIPKEEYEEFLEYRKDKFQDQLDILKKSKQDKIFMNDIQEIQEDKYITIQENKNKKPEIKISEYELKIKEEPKKVKDLKISNYDNEKNLKRALEKTMKSASANIYWIPISKGETLSSISKELTGKAENYLILAKLNSINDPSDIPVGFPLKIPKEYSNNSRVRYDNYPEKTMIMKRGQSIDDFVKNTLHIKSKIPSTIENILKYNMKLGNKIPVNGYSDLREAVVYIGD